MGIFSRPSYNDTPPQSVLDKHAAAAGDALALYLQDDGIFADRTVDGKAFLKPGELLIVIGKRQSAVDLKLLERLEKTLRQNPSGSGGFW